MATEIHKEHKQFVSLKGHSIVIQRRSKPICDISCFSVYGYNENYALQRDYQNTSPCFTVFITHVISQVLSQLWQLAQDPTDQSFSKLGQLWTLHSPVCHPSLHRHHRLPQAERQGSGAVLLRAEAACLLQISRTSKTKEISTKYEKFYQKFPSDLM